MRGIVLAGGTGTRLYPCTEVTNKHLLPVYDKPMIFHPLETLRNMGIKDIMIVTGGECMHDFLRLLGSGSKMDINFTYRIQDDALGIAHALLLAEDFAKAGNENEKIAVILGDNIFEDVALPKEEQENDNAIIFIKEVDEPERFGVVEFDNKNNAIKIEEKPKTPKSKHVVTGLYLYPNDVFDVIKKLKISSRGEYEITDVNNYYIEQGRMKVVKLDGFWSDAGTFDSLHKATSFIKKKRYS